MASSSSAEPAAVEATHDREFSASSSDSAAIETHDVPLASTWILTESHEYLKNVLSYLPAVQLFKCSRVCKQWKKEAERILKCREQLGWVSYNYDTAPDGGHDDHELGHFGRNLDECIQSLWSVPQNVLMFTELRSQTDYRIGTKQKGHFGGSSRGRQMRQQEIDETLSMIMQRLPSQCTLLSLETSGTIGTYQNMKLAGESEGEGAATAILFPTMQGVDIQIIKTTQKALFSTKKECTIEETMGITKTSQLKCLLIFGFGNSGASQLLPAQLQKSFRETRGCDPVIAGALADDLLTRNLINKSEASMKLIGLSFSGPNVQAASILLGADICTKDHVKQDLKRLKKAGLSEKKSIAFMFACVGRGIDFHEQESAESQAFQEIFPNTPLFGFFGNGEIGRDNMTCGRPVDSGEGLPNLMHGYTTIICMLSFGAPT